MYLTQKNRLKLSKKNYDIICNLSNHCARFYNAALYSVRQYWFDNNEYLNSTRNYHECKENYHFKMLLTDNSSQILRLIERNFKSFFSLLRQKKSGKYSEKINLPKYKKKNESILFSKSWIKGQALFRHFGL